MHALNYEHDILAAIMFIGDEAYDKVCDVVTHADFYDRRNANLFQMLGKMIAKCEPVAPDILAEKMKKSGEIERIGGEEHLMHIVKSSSISDENLPVKAKWIADLSLLRKLVVVSSNVIEKAGEFTGDLSAILDYADEGIAEIRNSTVNTATDLRHTNPILKETIANIEDRYNRGSDLVGVDTGYKVLNDILLGLIPKDLVILAAVPGMGKTTLAMNIVENALSSPDTKGPVIFFSQEMGDSELMERIISSVGRINQSIIRKGALDEYHWESLIRATTIIKDWPLYIDETNGITPSEMRSRCKRLVRQCKANPALIVVDYLQLMQIKGMEDNEVAKLSIVSSSLKSLAKEMKCPVLALSQLNRSIEKRPNKRPLNSDLKGSGSIEADADVIMFIYRDEVYNKNTKDAGIAEVVINKHRKGSTGTVYLGFDGRHSRFVNLADDYEPQSNKE